jgi:hypothetical protein
MWHQLSFGAALGSSLASNRQSLKSPAERAASALIICNVALIGWAVSPTLNHLALAPSVNVDHLG